METFTTDCFMIESYFNNTILYVNFDMRHIIKLFICMEYSIVKEIFDEYFKEVESENKPTKEEEQHCFFTFREKRISLEYAIHLSNEFNSLMCTKLDYVRNYLKKSDKKCESVPLKCSLINKYDIRKLAELIVEFLEE